VRTPDRSLVFQIEQPGIVQMMDAVRLLARAQDWTATKVAGVREPDLPQPTPCEDWDVSRLLDHLTADLETFNRVAGGDPVDLVSAIDPAAPENVGRAWPDPAKHFARLAEESRALWNRPGALEQSYKTSRSEMPGEGLIMITLIDTLVHGWDLAKATGQDAEMPEDVAGAALAFTTKMMKGRRVGFGEPVPVPDDASVTDRLVGWLGRHP
jgi:uncharacterized protein (TIGR03086 family)